MSITLERKELSLERESERAESDVVLDEDELLMVGSFPRGPIRLTPEAAARLQAANEQPPDEPTEWMKQAVASYERLTGKSVKEGALRTRTES
jgi:hypothetical protein